MIIRLRDVMTNVFPNPEEEIQQSHKGALILLTEYASPRRLAGSARLA